MSIRDYAIACVTGATRGIGAALVRELTARGLMVHAIARSAGALDTLARETGCRVHALDVGAAAAVQGAIGALEIDVLINNAALAIGAGPVHETEPEDVEALLRVNVAGVINCLRAAVPGMIERNRGHVVNLGSMAAHYPMQGMPAYGATKAAVHSLSQDLRMDLYGTDVRITEIAPGRVRTGAHAGLFGGDREKAEEQLYRGFACLEPGDVAAAVVYALDAPGHVDVTFLEIMPTHQVAGGARFYRRGGDR